jgi:hypothetical protein
MAYGIFSEGVRILENWGVMDILLPFFLVFVIVFAVLHKAKPLGKDSKKFNVIIALVMGFAVIFPHALRPGTRYDVVPIINNALPHIAIVLVAIVMLLLVLGVMGSRIQLGKNSLSGWVMIISVLIVLYIFGAAAGWFWGLPWWLEDPQTIAVVVTILVFAIVIGFITKDDKGDDKKKFGEGFSEILESIGDKD